MFPLLTYILSITHKVPPLCPFPVRSHHGSPSSALHTWYYLCPLDALKCALSFANWTDPTAFPLSNYSSCSCPVLHSSLKPNLSFKAPDNVSTSDCSSSDMCDNLTTQVRINFPWARPRALHSSQGLNGKTRESCWLMPQ